MFLLFNHMFPVQSLPQWPSWLSLVAAACGLDCQVSTTHEGSFRPMAETSKTLQLQRLMKLLLMTYSTPAALCSQSCSKQQSFFFQRAGRFQPAVDIRHATTTLVQLEVHVALATKSSVASSVYKMTKCFAERKPFVFV